MKTATHCCSHEHFGENHFILFEQLHRYDELKNVHFMAHPVYTAL